MSYAQAHTLIRRELLEWWESNYPSILLAGDNEDFVPPENEVWATMTVIPGSPRLAGIGGDPSSRRWRVVGQLVIQLFTPLKKGVSRAEELVGAVQKKFQGRTFDNVIFREVALVRLGQSGPWTQNNIVTNYQFDYYG